MVPASFNHHAKPVWQHVYSRFGLTLPLASPPTLVSRDRTAPYFNSGVIVVPGPVAKRLAASWIDTAMQIDGDPQVPDSSKRPNLSQLALPVAAARLGLGIEVLDPRWNFPGWSWRIAQEGVPILFHYQTMERLREEKPSLRAAMQAAEIHPSVRHALATFSYIERASQGGIFVRDVQEGSPTEITTTSPLDGDLTTSLARRQPRRRRASHRAIRH